PLRCRGNADDRLLLKQLVNPEGGCGRASEILDPVPIGFEQSEDLARRLGRLQRCLGDAVEEELQPCLPVAILADLLQQVVILAAMRLEVEAEIEDRLLQDALRAEQEGDQQAAEASVSVEERMDSLELDMDEPGLDEGRHLRRVGMDERLQVRHEVEDVLGGRRY